MAFIRRGARLGFLTISTTFSTTTTIMSALMNRSGPRCNKGHGARTPIIIGVRGLNPDRSRNVNAQWGRLINNRRRWNGLRRWAERVVGRDAVVFTGDAGVGAGRTEEGVRSATDIA